MSKKSIGVTALLPMVQIGYPQGLFNATTAKGYEKSEPRFGCPLAFEKGSDADKAIQAAVMEVIKLVKAQVNEAFAPSQDKISYDAETKLGEGLSQVRAYANQKYPPQVVGRLREPLTAETSQIGHGSFVNASVYVYYSSMSGGISVGLNAVQYVEDGELVGGAGVNVNDVFADLGGAAEDNVFANLDAATPATEAAAPVAEEALVLPQATAAPAAGTDADLFG